MADPSLPRASAPRSAPRPCGSALADPDRRAHARALWDRGLTYRLIAEKMGLTRGVVAGVAYRERWKPRPRGRSRASNAGALAAGAL